MFRQLFDFAGLRRNGKLVLRNLRSKFEIRRPIEYVIGITAVCPVPHQNRPRAETSASSVQIAEPSHYSIAFAGPALQLLLVKNADSTAFRSNHPRLLQLANCRGDRRATTAKYLGENFMGKRQDVRSSTITAHTEPAGKALGHLMQAITGGTLGYLHCLGVGKAAKHPF